MSTVTVQINDTQLRLLKEGLLTIELEYDNHQDAVVAVPCMQSHQYRKLSEADQREALAPME